MNKIDRRSFVKKSLQGSIAIAGASVTGNLFASSYLGTGNNLSAKIPKPIQVVIDDVGWWSGKNGSKWQEPYRTGIERNHTPADYQAIVSLGKALGIRPQAAMIIGEWDRKNILKNVTHSTWMEEKWDNSKWVGPWLDEAAHIITSNKDHFEMSVHGLAHEWWTNGKFTRAEWAEVSGIMRPQKDVERHLDAFADIMRQNNLGELPNSFVPTAFKHSFGITPGNDVSVADIFRRRGFTYINTPFAVMRNRELAQYKIFGVDSGIMTVDREENDLLTWYFISKKPEGEVKGTTCGMHWPNLLHLNPERNSEIVDAWVKLLAPYNDKQDTILAKNSLYFQKQLAHYKCTEIAVQDKHIKLDFSETNKIGTIISNDELTVKISSEKELKFTSDTITIESVSSKREHKSILYTLNLRKRDGEVALISF